MAEASARGVIATGPRRGCRVVRVRGPTAEVDAFVMDRLCAQVEGYNLQAATRVGANDRGGLERMGRYLSRPPFATDRLSQLDDKRFELRLKRPWRDGTRAFVFSPHELIERLVAQVPRPRAHLTRYHGSAGSRLRSQIADRAGCRSTLCPSRPEALGCAGKSNTEMAKPIPLGVLDLAGVPDGRSRMWSVLRANGDRRGSDIEGRNRPNP